MPEILSHFKLFVPTENDETSRMYKLHISKSFHIPLILSKKPSIQVSFWSWSLYQKQLAVFALKTVVVLPVLMGFYYPSQHSSHVLSVKNVSIYEKISGLHSHSENKQKHNQIPKADMMTATTENRGTKTYRRLFS
jgi:hypothetical protein